MTAGFWVVGNTGPGGGEVFYASSGTFTETSAACGSSCRYLEAAPAGWNSGGSPDPELSWGGGSRTAGECSKKSIDDALGTLIGTGAANTAAILAACPDAGGAQSAPAARAAACYLVTGTCGVGNYGEWFLSSRDELDALDLSGLGGLSSGDYYWSSSQVNDVRAVRQTVGEGGGQANQANDLTSSGRHVRAVRAF
ncbi:MAG: hypothetical protein NTV40_09575 [Solirubrobacterales bacterium]|nr:hypothetical protein [Solirubrobacterales bacterium]